MPQLLMGMVHLFSAFLIKTHKSFSKRVVAAEGALGFGQLAELAVDRLDGAGDTDHPANVGRVAEVGQQVNLFIPP